MGDEARNRPGNVGNALKQRIWHAALILLILSAGFFPLDEKAAAFITSLIALAVLLLSALTRPGASPQKAISVDNLIHLARFYAQSGQTEKAEKYYCRAIFRLERGGEMARAAGLFEEYFLFCRRVFAPRLQLELCRELCREGKDLVAARALSKLIEEWPRMFYRSDPRLLEQAYIHLARIYCEKLELPGLASDCYFALLERFPRTRYRETALFQVQVLDTASSMVI
jgi:hypothetical protein